MAERGYGQPGFCSICASAFAPIFVRGAREGGRRGDGWNSVEAMEMAKQYGLTFSRQTWYTHRDHARTGEQLVIQAAEKVRREGALTIHDIKKNSNKDVLEAIRDLGMAKALSNPDAISPELALKAISIMESRKDKSSDSLNILVQFVTGQPPAVVIEGTAREIPVEAIAE